MKNCDFNNEHRLLGAIFVIKTCNLKKLTKNLGDIKIICWKHGKECSMINFIFFNYSFPWEVIRFVTLVVWFHAHSFTTSITFYVMFLLTYVYKLPIFLFFNLELIFWEPLFLSRDLQFCCYLSCLTYIALVKQFLYYQLFLLESNVKCFNQQIILIPSQFGTKCSNLYKQMTNTSAFDTIIVTTNHK